MKYYILNKEIFAFELDGSQDHLITSDMKEISLEQIDSINKAKQEELEATKECKVQEAKAYLASTDWMVTRQAETGKAIPDEVKAKRQEARELI